MRIPKASEIADVGLIVASDGERFAIIRFVDGGVQLMPVDEFHHQAHRTTDWAFHLIELEADADRALSDRERDTA